VNRFLIEGVARAGLGEPFFVTRPDEATEAATKLRRYIDSPVLTGIDVMFAGFDAYDVEPRRPPDPADRDRAGVHGA
jgi:Ca-activated chloride channel homolog